MKSVLLVLFILQNSSFFSFKNKNHIDFVGMRMYPIQSWDLFYKLNLETVYNSGSERTVSL